MLDQEAATADASDRTSPDLASAPYRDAGISLCLSGGGYRAALFHLGVVRRLDEIGALSRIDTVTSVSGGSILAAFLASTQVHRKAKNLTFRDWDVISLQFRRLVSEDLRTRAFFIRALPWHWFQTDTSVRQIAARLDPWLHSLALNSLPERPNYLFCATDLHYGVNWVFSRKVVGDYEFGYSTKYTEWPLSLAVAASACFPPVFPPLRLDLSHAAFANGRSTGTDGALRFARRIKLSDGGLYDNLGLEPVWKRATTIVVSDGGAAFRPQMDKGPLWRIKRYAAIASQQARALRKRWLIEKLNNNSLTGCYIGITNPEQSRFQPYDQAVIARIAAIRTDLDSFSEAEAKILENHGYATAAMSATRFLTQLTIKEADYQLPHPEFADSSRALEAIQKSHRRRVIRLAS